MSQTVSQRESVQIEEKRAKDITVESTDLEAMDQNAGTGVGGAGGGSNKNLVALITAGLGFSTATVAAKMGLFGEGSYASNALIGQDLGSAFLCAILGAVFVKLNTVSVAQQWLEPRDARKVIHTLSGPLFMLFWPIFSSEPGARAFASVVPLVNAVRLVTAAYGGMYFVV
jgi:phytol kinase